MHKYLMDEHPILVYPTLAEALGLNEAIVLQKLHGWLFFYEKNPKGNEHRIHDGRYWIYGSAEYWDDEIPFLSSATIRRALVSLREAGIILTGNYNRKGYDRTLWYSIDYEAYDQVIDRRVRELEADKAKKAAEKAAGKTQQTPESADDLVNLDESICSDRANPFAQNEQMHLVRMSGPIPISSTKSSSIPSADRASSLREDARPQPKARQTSMGIRDPEQTPAFTSPRDKKLQAVLRAEARSGGRRGPSRFESMAQKQAWRVVSDEIVDLGGEAELDKAIGWALSHGRTSRDRLISTLQAWAENLKNPKPHGSRDRGGQVMTNDQYEAWARDNYTAPEVPDIDTDGVPF